ASITSQPAGQTVGNGTNVTLSVTAAGNAPLHYQWQKGGSGLTDATNSSLTLFNVQTTDSGTYSVLVSNLYGSVTSSNALLTVTNRASGVCASDTIYSSLVNGSFENGLTGWSSTPGMYTVLAGVDGSYAGDIGGGDITGTKV